MGHWYCMCGNRMSNSLSPTPHGYEVFTSKQCCDGDLDEQTPYADAYICPECGRIMIFGRGSDEYILYRPESVENIDMHDSSPDKIDRAIDEAEAEFANGGESADAEDVFKVSVSFSEEALRVYSELSGKEDTESKATVKDINALIEKLQNNGVGELPVRNKMVGPEHQLCYRAHKGAIDIVSIEWIFE